MATLHSEACAMEAIGNVGHAYQSVVASMQDLQNDLDTLHESKGVLESEIRSLREMPQPVLNEEDHAALRGEQALQQLRVAKEAEQTKLDPIARGKKWAQEEKDRKAKHKEAKKAAEDHMEEIRGQRLQLNDHLDQLAARVNFHQAKVLSHGLYKQNLDRPKLYRMVHLEREHHHQVVLENLQSQISKVHEELSLLKLSDAEEQLLGERAQTLSVVQRLADQRRSQEQELAARKSKTMLFLEKLKTKLAEDQTKLKKIKAQKAKQAEEKAAAERQAALLSMRRKSQARESMFDLNDFFLGDKHHDKQHGSSYRSLERNMSVISISGMDFASHSADLASHALQTRRESRFALPPVDLPENNPSHRTSKRRFARSVMASSISGKFLGSSQVSSPKSPALNPSRSHSSSVMPARSISYQDIPAPLRNSLATKNLSFDLLKTGTPTHGSIPDESVTRGTVASPSQPSLQSFHRLQPESSSEPTCCGTQFSDTRLSSGNRRWYSQQTMISDHTMLVPCVILYTLIFQCWFVCSSTVLLVCPSPWGTLGVLFSFSFQVVLECDVHLTLGGPLHRRLMIIFAAIRTGSWSSLLHGRCGLFPAWHCSFWRLGPPSSLRLPPACGLLKLGALWWLSAAGARHESCHCEISPAQAADDHCQITQHSAGIAQETTTPRAGVSQDCSPSVCVVCFLFGACLLSVSHPCLRSSFSNRKARSHCSSCSTSNSVSLQMHHLPCPCPRLQQRAQACHPSCLCSQPNMLTPPASARRHSPY